MRIGRRERKFVNPFSEGNNFSKLIINNEIFDVIRKAKIGFSGIDAFFFEQIKHLERETIYWYLKTVEVDV